jgi:hypothetical protein
MDTRTKPLLQIWNTHIPECGDPPIIEEDDNLYVAYLHTLFGQMILTIDCTTKRGKLYDGDRGWNNPIDVPDGLRGQILAPEIVQWLCSAWRAALGSDELGERVNSISFFR